MKLLRDLLDPHLLMSSVAMARAIPRTLRLTPVDGMLFFTVEKRSEYRRRIEGVTPQSPRQWGSMEVDQMLHHLNLRVAVRWAFTISPTRAIQSPEPSANG